MTYKYLVVIEKTQTGYSAYSPDVQGCVATAKTADAAKSAMSEAIEFHLEGLAESGENIPVPKARHAFATVRADTVRSSKASSYHILPAQGKWIVKRQGASRASRIHSSKESAIQHARQLARRQSGKVVVHNRDGSTRFLGSHGSKPSGSGSPK